MSDLQALADAIYEAPLPAAEFDARLERALEALAGAEGEEIRALIDWFTRRYPDPLARLAYARRKYREAERMRGIADRVATKRRSE